MFKIIYLKII